MITQNDSKEETNPSSSNSNKVIIDLSKEEDEDKELMNLLASSNDDNLQEGNDSSFDFSLTDINEKKEIFPVFRYKDISKNENNKQDLPKSKKLILPKIITVGNILENEKNLQNYKDNSRYNTFNKLIRNTNILKYKSLQMKTNGNNVFNFEKIKFLPKIK